MSTTEDRARAAMRAIAASVNDAPPLALKPAPDPGSAPGLAAQDGSDPDRPGVNRSATSRSGRSARGPRPPGGTAGPPRGGYGRRWRSWLAPLTAAFVVVALAISLVLVKNLPNGRMVPQGQGTMTPTGPGGTPSAAGGQQAIPRYYLAIKHLAARGVQSGDGLVVGDSVTGKTLATFAPPANATFQSVSAAADDRTFVAAAVTFPSGRLNVNVLGHATLTATWYQVRITPGGAHPATLTRLPVKPVSWVSPEHPELDPQPGQIFAVALSASGKELAISDIPQVRAAAGQARDWQEVKVFSVATGRLLHDWIGHDPASNLFTASPGTFYGIPGGTPDLTWVDGDRAVTLATAYQESKTVVGGDTTMTAKVRRLSMAGPASGDLIKNSTVIWSGTLWSKTVTSQAGCLGDWPPAISADASTITCVIGYDSGQRQSFVTEPLTAGTTASTKPTVVYQATASQVGVGGWLQTNFLWASPSADTFIVQWVYGGRGFSLPDNASSGVLSHGRFTPLRIPKSVTLSAVDITF